MGKDVKGWRYQYQGEYLTSWAKINDKWYHFDGNGRMETGWILDDMYYTGDDGGDAYRLAKTVSAG